MSVITKQAALTRIANGQARAETLVYHEGATWVAITRYDLQRTDHVRIGGGDLRDTEDGRAVEAQFGIAA